MTDASGPVEPLEPTRIVGGSVVAASEPSSYRATDQYDGYEMLPAPYAPSVGAAPPASTQRAGDSSRATTAAASLGPYRSASPGTLPPRPVRVRQVSRYLADDAHFGELMRRTAAHRAAMRGSAAPRLLHVFCEGERVAALVEERLHGTPLRQLLDHLSQRAERLPPPHALAIAADIVALFEHAAARGVRLWVGADDVLVTESGAVRVDPAYAIEHARTEVGAAAGLMVDPSVVYLSPDEILGAAPSARDRMFTTGLLLYEMLAGAHPAVSDADSPALFAILSRMREPLPPLRERCEVPPALGTLVDRCVATDEQSRFSSWSELREALAAVRGLWPPIGPADRLAYLSRATPPTLWPRAFAPAPLAAPASTRWHELPSMGYRRVDPASYAPESGADDAERPAPAHVTAGAPAFDSDLLYPAADMRPMLRAGSADDGGDLLVDARPVTAGEYERFLIASGAPSPRHWSGGGSARGALGPADAPACLVSLEEARRYARWAGKRLPTEHEWATAVGALGAERLGVGAVWEWTETPAVAGGVVVRGGRWRDQWQRPPSPDNRSHEDVAASDVGFRCVLSRERQHSDR